MLWPLNQPQRRLGVYVRTFCFFFQAEDGIRDKLVTGVQTCALPIFSWSLLVSCKGSRDENPVCLDFHRGAADGRLRRRGNLKPLFFCAARGLTRAMNV